MISIALAVLAMIVSVGCAVLAEDKKERHAWFIAVLWQFIALLSFL